MERRGKKQKWTHPLKKHCQIQAKDGKGLIQAGARDSGKNSVYPG